MQRPSKSPQAVRRRSAGKPKTAATGKTRSVVRKARSGARRAAREVSVSVEARRAMARARSAVDALAKAASATGALIQAAWRTSGGRARNLADSREVRALQSGARQAMRNATAAARAAGVAAEERGEKAWRQAVASSEHAWTGAVTRGRKALARARRRLRRA